MCVKPKTHMAKSEGVGHEKNESSPTNQSAGGSGASGSPPPNKTSSKHEDGMQEQCSCIPQPQAREGILSQ